MRSPSLCFPPRLLFTSGKGGVGKTTVSLAIACAAAKSAKKTLWCALSDTPQVAMTFKLKTLEYAPQTVAPHLDLALLDPASALQEYLGRELHLGFLGRRAFKNRLVANFLDAIPGLNELLLLGKLRFLTSRTGPSAYDFIVVDTYASGHAIAMFGVPKIVKKAIPTGPLKRHAEAILALFKDPALAQLSLVAIAEDLPVKETLELKKSSERDLAIALGPLFLNAILPDFAKGHPAPKLPAHPAFDAARFYEARMRLQHSYRKELAEAFPSKAELPFIDSVDIGLEEIDRLADVLLEQGLLT